MKAALYRKNGPARDVLSVEDVERPEPGPGQVRVRIALSAINPTDYKTRDGATGRPIDGFQIPHQDGAGDIDAVGDGVDPGRVGERVWLWLAADGNRYGTAAEYAVVPAERAVPLPDGVSYELGACLGVPAMTAYRCLYTDGPLDGRTVLVAGGAGAVGHYAIELAKRGGATVVATASGPEKLELARAAGADHVVNYHDEDAAEQITGAVGGVDRIIEVAPAANLELDLSVLAPHGTVVSYAAEPENPSLPTRRLMSGNVVLRFVLLYGVPHADLTAYGREISLAAADGAITPLAIHRYPLTDVVAAHEAAESGVTGKIVLDPTA